ncbi:molybdopterin adenylyltransferase [Hydrogenispora ethanolica]|uniref:Molybdopterin adenylyltransferase n=1 Tax=Hydrogenispora ethanolica TaxID=1082276 RepID=A0A4R1S2P0_HYDET|nr:MogA/MoaB family molybdenum cofactor biosynthesis protein [Hydrogenispora ethanolica]TCL73164.1 molybdopterin adenylyltransferase [Hydrogenispora ethanolica]
MIRFSILVASDQGSAGQREDRSGPAIAALLKESGAELLESRLVPDERPLIAATLIQMCDRGADLILTSGGTGFSPRDVTPEATLDVIERQVPGIPEAMRARSLAITPRAMLSRAVAGIRGRTLIINLPGSPKAVRECLEVVLPVLDHAIAILTGTTGECAR